MGIPTVSTTNQQLAQVFQAMATLLASQRANPYRVRAYRRAAESILALEEDIAVVAARAELEEIDGIGKDLAGKITEFLETGTIRAYEEMKTPLPPEVKSWAKLPGLSDSLVSYLYSRLGIRTLTDLEQLVRSHMLRTVPGFTGSEDQLLQAITQQHPGRNV
jgi:DNA polymerase (family 10)